MGWSVRVDGDAAGWAFKGASGGASVGLAGTWMSLEIIGLGIQLAMTEKTEKLFQDRFMTRFIMFQNRSA